MADVLFDLRGGATALWPSPPALDQTRVHQQAFYEPTTQLVYITQVIANGVTLADESGPPPTGTRDSRGDLAVNRVNLSGQVTGVMYCRRFDHGSGIGVEYDAATGKTWVWLPFDAEIEPIGTNAHGRRLCRIEFVNGAIIDPEDVPADQAYEPVAGATAITPGLDLVNGRMTIAYSQGSGTQYSVYDLAAFKRREFYAPLYQFARPSYADFQSWCAFGDYIYQQHGSAYDDADNPPPPDGDGNAWWTVIDMRTGGVVDRVHNTYALSLEYREPESLAVWAKPPGPELVFGFAVDEAPRRVALYRITATVDVTVPVRAEVVAAPEAGVQLTVSVEDTATIQTWEIGRTISGTRQVLFAGQGEGSLPAVSTWMDEAPPGCIPIVYWLAVHRTTGQDVEYQSVAVTYVPEGGCNQGGEAVGEQDNTLGCAATYVARLHWRGGALPYEAAVMDELTEVTWSRTINDVSEASVTVLKSDVSSECCRALGQAEPWVHELTIYRDGELVWQGPITKTISRRDTIVIQAQDVTAWFDHLVNTWRVTYTTATPDSAGRAAGPIPEIAYNHIRLNMLASPLNVADYAGIMEYMTYRVSRNMRRTRFRKDGSKGNAIWTAYLGDILREWAKRGLTWTAIGRHVLLRGHPDENTRAQARLTMDDFIGDVEVIKDGTQAGTYGYATSQKEDISVGKTLGYGRTKTAYGRLDRLVELTDDDVTDTDLRMAAQEAVSGRYPIPVAISVPDGAALAPTAPVVVRQLVPGERFDVVAENFCQPVLQGFVLTDVEGSWQNGQEKIGVTLTPLADIDEELNS
ncbi:hypothetical protein [Streptomyces longwoodensis]|uniref:hypothetical protein n=1 Tax=Streptomyces longwoodensis TaxID=68231 RepID=UPI0036FEA4A0